MREARGLLVAALVFLGLANAAHGTLPAPGFITATIQGDPSGIFLMWEGNPDAIGYQIQIFESYFATLPIATISRGPAPGYLNQQPCGSSNYYEVRARDADDNVGPPSRRVFGQSNDCPFAVRSCEVDAVAVTGSGTYTGSTFGQTNNYGLSGVTCTSGAFSGFVGAGRDVVYRYSSAVDCDLTVTLKPTAANPDVNFYLFMSETCVPGRCDEFSNNGSPFLETISFPVSAGQDYFIFVDGVNEINEGRYEISFITDDCRSGQDCDLLQEGFSEGGIPQGWFAFNQDSIPDPGLRHKPRSWGVIEDLTGPLYNRVAAAYADPEAGADTEDWLVTEPVTIGEDAVLRWRDARLGAGGPPFALSILFSESTTPASFLANPTLLTLNLADIGTAFTQRELPLAAAGLQPGTYRFAFRHVARDTGYLFLDDIGVCGAPTGGGGEGEGMPEGEVDGEEPAATHSADQNNDGRIVLSELLRVIQFFNSGGLHCANPPGSTEDGYVPGANGAQQGCAAHASDYNPQNWVITLSELLRLIQFYNSTGFYPCAQGEDGFCPGTP